MKTAVKLAILGLLACGPARADSAADEALLQKAGVAADGAALLDFLGRWVPGPGDEKRLAEWIGQLDSNNFAARQQAEADLLAAGPKALRGLRRALAAPGGLERERRVQKCIAGIERGVNEAATAAAVRLLRVRNPEGAVALLLDFISQGGADLEAETLRSLLALGVRDGTPSPLVVAALGSTDPTRRGAAAALLGRHGNAAQRRQVQELLADADSQVRCRAAQGLLAGRDKSAVPTLLALTTDTPLPVAELALDLLERLAGADAPKLLLGDSAAQRRHCRDAWEAWWKQAEAGLDLARADLDFFQPEHARRARRFVEMILVLAEKGDAKNIAPFLGAPFCFQGDVSGVEGAILALLPLIVADQQPTFAVTKVLELADYTKAADDRMAKFLPSLRKDEVRAVYVEAATKQGGKGAGVLLVRCSAGKMRLIGYSTSR